MRPAQAAAVAITIFVASSALMARSAPARLSYTLQQADAGRLDYYQYCAECHGGELEGVFGPALAGTNSRTQWESPQYVYGYFRVAMPHGHPGQLSAREYIDIMAFILQRHAKPAGVRPLTVTAIMNDTSPIGE